MPTETVDSRELIKERLDAVNAELGRMDFNDPNRSKLVSEAKTYADMLKDYDQTDITRINNNVKNDFERERIAIDEKKVSCENKKIALGWGQLLIGVLAGWGIHTWSYVLGENMQPDRPMTQFANEVYKKVDKFTIK